MYPLRSSEENTRTRGFISEPYEQLMQSHIDTIDSYHAEFEAKVLQDYLEKIDKLSDQTIEENLIRLEQEL